MTVGTGIVRKWIHQVICMTFSTIDKLMFSEQFEAGNTVIKLIKYPIIAMANPMYLLSMAFTSFGCIVSLWLQVHQGGSPGSCRDSRRTGCHGERGGSHRGDAMATAIALRKLGGGGGRW